MFDKVKKFISWMFGEVDHQKEFPELKELDEKHQKERWDFLGEFTESTLARWFPGISKFMDLLSSTGVTNKDPEVVARQNEFEGFTARSMFIPDFLLKYVSNPILKMPGFELLVKNYPLWWEAKDKLLDENNNLITNPDPDDVINFLRLVNQDIVSGKIGVEMIKD